MRVCGCAGEHWAVSEALQAEALSQHSGEHPSPLLGLQLGWIEEKKTEAALFLAGFAEGAGGNEPFRLEAGESPGLCLGTAVSE